MGPRIRACSIGSFASVAIVAASIATAQPQGRSSGTTLPGKLPGALKRPSLPNAGPGFLSKNRQTLVVFIHGITPASTPGHQGDWPSLPDDQGTALDKTTLAFSRNYWTFDFVRGCLGGSADLYTLDGQPVGAAAWSPTKMERPEAHPNLPPSIRVCDEIPDPTGVRHFCSPQLDARNAARLGLLIDRDGTLPYVQQVADAAHEIAELYTQRFSVTDGPQIVLIGHSMGGLVARGICTNFTQSLPSGQADTQLGLSSLSKDECDFIRSRTLYVITLAAPHLGSAIPDYMTKLDAVTPDCHRNRFPFTLYFSSAHRECMYDLRTSRWSALNAGALRLDKMQRPDGTPIPIHMFGGRSPAGGFMRSLDPAELAAVTRADGRSRFEAAGLIGIEGLLTQTSVKGSWGKTMDPMLDQVQSSYLGAFVARVANEAQELLPPPMQAPLTAARAGGEEKVAEFLGLAPVPQDVAASLELCAPAAQAPPYPPRLPLYLDHPYVLKRGRPPLAACVHFQANAIGLPSLDRSGRPIRLHPDESCVPMVVIPALESDANQVARDGEIDSDGMVSIASSLAWGLGWEHNEGGGAYRHPESGPWSLTNHGSIKTEPALARYLSDKLLRRAGPRPAAASAISTW